MKKTSKIIICLLLIALAFTVTSCTQTAATEQEVRTFNKDGFQYSIIEVLEGEKVVDTYAKMTKYLGAAENVTIPDKVDSIKVTTISSLAFYSSKIKSVTIPEGVTVIETFAFGYSDIISVDIPSTIKSIGDYAFINCLRLKEVVISAATKPTVGAYSFKYYNTETKDYAVSDALEIKVPSRAVYKPDSNNDHWTQYQNNIKEVA
jgi:hypothetical protein